MRFNTILTAVMLYLTSLALAAMPSGGDWSGETTITVTSSYSTTLTVTKYLTYANATSTTSHSVKPTGWNVTSTYATGATTSHVPASTIAAASSSVFPPIASATGAANALEMNLAVAAIAGAAAVFFSL